MNIQNLKCLLETAESNSVTAMAGRCILEQFLFIEILCVVQSLLCHVAKHTGKPVKLRESICSLRGKRC